MATKYEHTNARGARATEIRLESITGHTGSEKQTPKPAPKIDICSYIPTGADSAMTAREIARRFGMDGSAPGTRQITRLIEQARKDGAPICASCVPDSKQGYYVAADAEELEEYLRRLQSRHDAIGETIKGMRRGRIH